MKNSKRVKIWIVIITSLASIIGIFIRINIKNPLPPPPIPLIFSGTVLDERGAGIKFALVQIVGKTEFCNTENNGNFLIEIPVNDNISEKRIKIIISHKGFKPLYQSVTLPAEGMVFTLFKE